jgi:uncharacterized protein with HEPN domain
MRAGASLIENRFFNNCGGKLFAKTGPILLDSNIQDAVNRNLEIIGEATKRIPGELKDHNEDIPWRQMAGLRDVLIHDYMGVSNKIVWNVVQNELPQLLVKIEKLVD